MRTSTTMQRPVRAVWTGEKRSGVRPRDSQVVRPGCGAERGLARMRRGQPAMTSMRRCRTPPSSVWRTVGRDVAAVHALDRAPRSQRSTSGHIPVAGARARREGHQPHRATCKPHYRHGWPCRTRGTVAAPGYRRIFTRRLSRKLRVGHRTCGIIDTTLRIKG